MNINEPITMGNIFKNLNLFKKIGVSLFLIVMVVYFVLSVKFIFS